MADVSFQDVTKEFPGGTTAVEGLSLHIPDGEFMILVGPPGCGKTTALRLVAGLESATSGTITIGGRAVTHLSPRDRDIAMVFQNYALYPHMIGAPQPRLRPAAAARAQATRSTGGWRR